MEVRFRLPASLGDWITFPEHLIQMPSSFALMSKNCLHLILLFSIYHYWGRWLLHPMELLRTHIFVPNLIYNIPMRLISLEPSAPLRMGKVSLCFLQGRLHALHHQLYRFHPRRSLPMHQGGRQDWVVPRIKEKWGITCRHVDSVVGSKFRE